MEISFNVPLLRLSALLRGHAVEALLSFRPVACNTICVLDVCFYI